MARPPKNNEIETALIDTEEFSKAVTDSDAMAQMDRETQANAQAIADQLGYHNSVISVGILEDEIRLYQRRTAECVLELGKRLLILKELSPHGGFEQRIELLGFHVRSAQRFMSAALKFSKSDNLSLLAKSIDSQSKLLELVTLDDSDLQQIANGESVRGITLEDIETMTASQLKAALKEAQLNEKATAKVLSDKNAAIDKLSQKLHSSENRVATLPPDDIARQLRNELMTFAFEAEHTIVGKIAPAIAALLQHTDLYGGDDSRYIHGLLREVEVKCAALRQQFPQIDYPDHQVDLTDSGATGTPLITPQAGDVSAADILKS
jgi:phosphotransferase system HPr-like phosphotransfer protein